jgi:hypothetical protein
LRTFRHYSIGLKDGEDVIFAYLTRYHLFKAFGFQLLIHNIHRSDSDRELHTHPWGWIGLILKGGYWEHRLSGVYRRRPGQPLILGRSKLHRVELPAGQDSWSLVFAFPRGEHSWCFLMGKKLIPWVTFTRMKGLPIGNL